jgi:hypothetical protein
MNRLSKDETLVSVKMGKEYLDGVLVNILAAEASGLDPEKLRIRIGVTGQGSRPNYRIESSQLEGLNSPSICRPGAHSSFRTRGFTRHFAGLTIVRWLNLMTSEVTKEAGAPTP